MKHIHIVGVGGAGMSGIARVLIARGFTVSGSDARDSRRLQALTLLGARVYVGHDAHQMLAAGTPDEVVASTAIAQNNVELVAARELGIPVRSRADALADLVADYRTVSVAGTHGKTTTTSMVTVVLQHAGLNPSFVIGSEMNESGSNAHQGTGDLFVVEADESDGTFLRLGTQIAIVTNVEPDHLNYWANYQAIEDAFTEFICSSEVSVVCIDDPGAATVARRAQKRGARVVTYGTDSSADAVLAVQSTSDGAAHFTVTYHGAAIGPIMLRVPGVHNARNATAAAVVALEAGVSPAQVREGLEAFTGTHRRFEYRGQERGIRVFDDYAHHPTEIDAVLRAARMVAGDGRVIVAFQAHHYYRTAMYSKEFAMALGLADFAVVLEVFAPGETPIPGASGSTMAAQVPLPQGQVIFEPSWSAVPGHLVATARQGDIIMTLGAGDIGMMCPTILELLRA